MTKPILKIDKCSIAQTPGSSKDVYFVDLVETTPHGTCLNNLRSFDSYDEAMGFKIKFLDFYKTNNLEGLKNL